MQKIGSTYIEIKKTIFIAYRSNYNYNKYD